MFTPADTETTGFKKSGALIQPGQARICQIAMILCDDEGNHKSEFSTLIKPEGWEIGEGAFRVHGITTNDCYKYGMPMLTALHIIHAIMHQSELLIFHNEEFDWGMLEIEHAYNSFPLPSIRRYCTMKNNVRVHGGKGGTLEKNLRHYCDRAPSKAHDAMGDAIDCKDIFIAMLKKGSVSL